MSRVSGFSRRRATVAGPSRPGIMTSSRIASGRSARAMATPLAPSRRARHAPAADGLEAQRRHLANVVLVIDEQDVLRAHGSPPRCRRWMCGRASNVITRHWNSSAVTWPFVRIWATAPADRRSSLGGLERAGRRRRRSAGARRRPTGRAASSGRPCRSIVRQVVVEQEHVGPDLAATSRAPAARRSAREGRDAVALEQARAGAPSTAGSRSMNSARNASSAAGPIARSSAATSASGVGGLLEPVRARAPAICLVRARQDAEHDDGIAAVSRRARAAPRPSPRRSCPAAAGRAGSRPGARRSRARPPARR